MKYELIEQILIETLNNVSNKEISFSNEQLLELTKDIVNEIQRQHNLDVKKMQYCDNCNYRVLYQFDDVFLCEDCKDNDLDLDLDYGEVA